ncbi:hypothetical protein EIK77_005460 [Talaromyces pinophilus]|nr:hypothetical protein EIK77_005460 [Talaromyces pinophilus]
MNIPTGLYNAGVPDYFTDSHHAAWWGRQCAQSKTTINGWVQSSQPDFLFILLGFNDLGWWVSDPQGLLNDMKELVDNARAEKPNIKMLIGNVVERSFIGGRQDLVDNTKTYNQMLKDAIPGWSTSESPISYVDVNSNYNCRPSGCPDGHDGLHPNSMGEYHIAQAFANVLKADFGYPGPAFVVPSSAEPRVVTTPTGFEVESMPEGLWAAWSMVETARNYDLRSRLRGVSEWWSDGAVSPNTWASMTTWLIDGQTWEFQVRTHGDNDDASDWSDIVAATAHLKTSRGPQEIQAVPVGSDSIQISWAPVTGYDVNRYGVIVWDRDTKGAFIQEYATTGTTYTATGLNTGHRYGTWVATYVNLESSVTGKVYPAGGLPAGGPELYVGGGTPSPPRNLVATNTDPTTVTITWDASVYTASYSIYVRSVRDNTAFQLGGTTTDTTVSWAYLFPGTWNFEFCVAAVNGELQSMYTDACVIPPVYSGYSQSDKRLVVTMDSSAIVFNSTSNTTTTQDQELSMLWQLLAQSRARNSSSPPS